MNHYNVPRYLGLAAALLLLGACAHQPKKPVVQAASATPAPATTPAPAASTAPPPVMQSNAPQRYTVKKGDTLWGIANLYLRDPWRWPDIWYANPDIKNPHLIFPGDVLILGYTQQGQPVLSVERNGQPVTEATVLEATPAPAASSAAVAPTTAPIASSSVPAAIVPSSALPSYKMEPQPRYLPLDQAVTLVPLDGLRPYLDKTRVIASGELDDAGYMVSSFTSSPVAGSGDQIYAKGLKSQSGARYDVYRIGDKYVDPDSGSNLGYEATYIGTAMVETWSDPQKLLVTSSDQELLAGDRLLPATGGQGVDLNFYPHHPDMTVQGQIMAVLGGVGQIGQFDEVVLNRGTDAGLNAGTVLGIYRKGDKVRDPKAGWFGHGTVKLPSERTGTLLVFRCFKQVSYGLVMNANAEIHLEDFVGNP